MGNNVLKILYSNSEEEDFVECDICGEKVFDKELKICPHCDGQILLPTISEYGKRLPIGIEQDGQLLKDFDIIPLNWKRERKISSIISSQEWKNRMTISNYIGLILAHCVTSIGGADISKFSVDKKIRLLHEMYEGDVYYMYAYLRLISLGSELALKNLECTNNSKHKFGIVLDVGSLKVLSIENVNELKRSFELEDGLMLDKELRKKITILPSKWNAIDIGVNSGEAELMDKMFLNSLYEIEGFNPGTQLDESCLDELTKKDANIIKTNLERRFTGPLWVADITCPECNTKMLFTVNWGFKDFFTDSYTYGRR